MTDDRIFELASLHIGYDRTVRTLDFARAIEREVLATRTQGADDAQPVAAMDDIQQGLWLREQRYIREEGYAEGFRAATRDAALTDAPIDEQAMFESWCLSNGWLRINLERNPATGYVDRDIDDMWDGWNARAHIAASAQRDKS
jgi:hypothetical protein